MQFFHFIVHGRSLPSLGQSPNLFGSAGWVGLQCRACLPGGGLGLPVRRAMQYSTSAAWCRKLTKGGATMGAKLGHRAIVLMCFAVGSR